MKSRLRRELQKYLDQQMIPMHMPGHKRKLFPEEDLPYDWDLTEVEGVDDLHHPSGILKEAQDRTAMLYGAKRTWYLVNGSTSGNLAGVFAMVRKGSEVLMDRCCHRSLFHIIELMDLKVHWLLPETDPATGITGSIDPSSIASLLDQHSSVQAVILTSPTYEGVISDISSIAEICHQHSVPLFVDEAHGAHLGLFEKDFFPQNSVQAGADLVVQSFHKTLPSLTQTAVLHLQGDLVSETRVQEALDIFETSSPSYPLMVSLDACTEYLLEQGEQAYHQWRKRIETFENSISDLRHYRVLCHQGDLPAKHGFYAFDPSKITIDASQTGLTGAQLQKQMRQRFHIELEMSQDSHALAMTGPGDTMQDLTVLSDALHQLDQEVCTETIQEKKQPASFTLPKTVMSLNTALAAESESIDLGHAEGRCAAEFVYCYPPGIPILIPGEVISRKEIDHLKQLKENGVHLRFTSSTAAGLILVTKV